MRRVALLAAVLLSGTVIAADDLTVLKPGEGRDAAAEAPPHVPARRVRQALRRTPQGGSGEAEDARGRRGAADGAARRSSSRRSAASPRRRRSTRSRRHAQARRLPRREGHLREPARPPRHREPLPARRQRPVPRRADAAAATAPTARPPTTYQRGCILLAKNGIAVLVLRPDRPGRAAPAARQDRQARRSRAARPSTRWSASAPCSSAASTASYRIWDGIRSLDYLASRPEIDAKQLGCTGNSGGGTLTVVPDGPRRPHRRRGAVVLHHLARTALRHDRPAGRRAEHHRPGRLRHGPRRLRRPARPEADADPRRRHATSSTSRGRGPPSARRSGSTACSATASASTCSSRTRSTATRSRTARRWPAGCAAGCSGEDDAIDRGRLRRSRRTPTLQCTRSGQVLDDLKGKSVFDLNAALRRPSSRRSARAKPLKPDEFRDAVAEARSAGHGAGVQSDRGAAWLPSKRTRSRSKSESSAPARASRFRR